MEIAHYAHAFHGFFLFSGGGWLAMEVMGLHVCVCLCVCVYVCVCVCVQMSVCVNFVHISIFLKALLLFW